MSDPFTEFAVQTQSTLSSLGTLLEEHETAMRDLDREISEQDLDTYDAGTIYRMKVCAEKRAILEENREEILDNISQNEVMLSALRRISHLEVTCSGLQDQLKLMMSEGEKVDTRYIHILSSGISIGTHSNLTCLLKEYFSPSSKI